MTKVLAMCSLRCEKQVKCEFLNGFMYKSSCIIPPHMAPLSLVSMEKANDKVFSNVVTEVNFLVVLHTGYQDV